MLGSEAVMLRHPVLKKLWRARHAEARLLAYDSEAVLRDLRPDPLAPPAERRGAAAAASRASAARSCCAWTPRARCAARPRPWPRRSRWRRCARRTASAAAAC